MKRKAFIVIGVGYTAEQSLKMTNLGSIYQTFLGFNMGGAWEIDEIYILEKPSISDLKKIIIEQKLDYALIILIGHGANKDNNQLFHLNKDTIIQAGQFTLDVPKQLIIVESCRNENEDIEFASIRDRIPSFKKGGVLRFAITREEAKRRFDIELSKSEKGVSICFACSKDESAIDFCFSNTLLQNSMQWHEKTNQSQTLSISEIMEKTISEVRETIQLKYNKQQTPELVGKVDFPFVVNKY